MSKTKHTPDFRLENALEDNGGFSRKEIDQIVASANALAGMDPGKLGELVKQAGVAADILGEMDQYPRLRTALAALLMEGSK